MDTNAQETILRLVNEKNDLYRDVTLSNVTLSAPVVADPVLDPLLDFRNTAVTLTGILNTGYKGNTQVFYRRFDLGTLFEGVSPETRDTAPTLEKVLTSINLRYGTYITLDDIANPEEFPTWEAEELEVTRSYELRINDPNYEWLGTVTIDIVQGNPLLETVVSVQLLPMLVHPDDPTVMEGRQSGTLMTWAYDFTPWVDRLVIDPETRRWAVFADVLEVGRVAKLDYWYNNTVGDFPTSAVPSANPRFERVMIQNYAGGGVTGPLYFHYDINW